MILSARISVVIADDHPVFRNGLRDILEIDGRFELVAEAGDGVEALELIRRYRPAAAVLDIEMPGLSGIDVVRALNEENLPTAILILTMYQQEGVFNRAMELGVTGYVLKDSVAAEICEGIVAVTAGRYYVSPAMLKLSRNDGRSPLEDGAAHLLERLTETERLVLRLIGESQTTKEIAGKLHISPRTVDTHRRNISGKLELNGSYKLLRFALSNRERL